MLRGASVAGRTRPSALKEGFEAQVIKGHLILSRGSLVGVLLDFPVPLSFLSEMAL